MRGIIRPLSVSFIFLNKKTYNVKFRIVQIIHRVDELSVKSDYSRSTVDFVIQKKNFWGCWKEIFSTEIKPNRICHKTYEDAEAYMIHKYMGHGMCEKIGIEYNYTPYTYFTG